MSSASPPSIDELAPSVFLSKAVRDLHWVLASPHLLTPLAGVPCCDDAWCAQIVAQSLPCRWRSMRAQTTRASGFGYSTTFVASDSTMPRSLSTGCDTAQSSAWAVQC